MKKYFLPLLFLFLASSCEKNITVDLPKTADKLVVEGWIESGLPPFVILTKSTAYFGSTDLAAFENSFVHDAIIEVNDGTTLYTLTEFCSQNFTPDQLVQISEAVGLPLETLIAVNYCLYTNLTIVGQPTKNYALRIRSEGKEYTSSTQIPGIITLDSTWFKLEKDQASKGFGFAYGHLTDPDSLGNSYRWRAKRLGKDGSFLVPFGASFTDLLINGKSFEFGFNRPADGNTSSSSSTQQEDDGYYKIGDTIVVKFGTVDKQHYDFLFSYENYLISNGNPFASPTSIKTNINGGALGVWGGYGISYDTIIAR